MKAIKTHGLSKCPENAIWRGIKQRCYNPRHTSFANYGGRGIRVCDRWLASFSDFISDVGHREHRDLTLDRIDNDGNYEPGNVRWATRTVQNQNTRLTPEERHLRGKITAERRWRPETAPEPRSFIRNNL